MVWPAANRISQVNPRTHERGPAWLCPPQARSYTRQSAPVKPKAVQIRPRMPTSVALRMLSLTLAEASCTYFAVRPCRLRTSASPSA